MSADQILRNAMGDKLVDQARQEWLATQSFAPARGSTACHECKRDTSGEMTWPGEAGQEICQECWEAECSRSWWNMVEQLNKCGLLEAPQNDKLSDHWPTVTLGGKENMEQPESNDAAERASGSLERAGSVAGVESEVRNLVCYRCKGDGRVSVWLHIKQAIIKCPACDGTGRIRITKPPNDPDQGRRA